MDNTKFEEFLSGCKNAIERFVYYKLPSKTDGDDVLQEVYLTAFQKFDLLKDESSFKAWIIRIAANKCHDFYRSRAKQLEIPLDETLASTLTVSRFGIIENSAVYETLEMLSCKDKQILYLYYLKNKPQKEIAKALNIPVGTVKSRLHNAKQNFKENYPYPPKLKGVNSMNKLPELLPEYKITKSEKAPFAVKWEELMGWFIIPKIGEKLSWAMYDFPARKRTELTNMKVIGKAIVHGIEGVEILATDSKENVERSFVAQLTDTHCRILAETHTKCDVKHYSTFLDADDFIPNWGFGENNFGNQTDLVPKGIIQKIDSKITCKNIPEILDVVGRYTVEIGGKIYDTICVMDIELYNNAVATEQYIDTNGHTVLWRRFNRNDWAFNRYKQNWAEKLPINERITINGETYVHWYSCITDHIL